MPCLGILDTTQAAVCLAVCTAQYSLTELLYPLLRCYSISQILMGRDDMDCDSVEERIFMFPFLSFSFYVSLTFLFCLSLSLSLSLSLFLSLSLSLSIYLYLSLPLSLSLSILPFISVLAGLGIWFQFSQRFSVSTEKVRTHFVIRV